MDPHRLYRKLLRILPENLRKGFGDDMTSLFLDRLSEARGLWAKSWVWLRAVADLLRASLQRADLKRQSQPASTPNGTPRAVALPLGPSRGNPMNALLQDVRYATRGLLKNPQFTLVAVLTLALGIGASTVAFTLVNGVLIRPLPFSEPDRLVMLRERRADGEELTLSFPNFDDWRNEAKTLEGIAAIRFAAEATVLGGEEPARGTIVPVSREFFDVLGVQPFLGRPILSEENREGGEQVVVLGYEFWARNLAANTDLDTINIMIAGRSYAVVGVMPPLFKVFEKADVYLPLELRPFKVRDSHNYRAIGRLAHGVTLDQTQTEMDGIVARIRDAYPGETQTVAVSMSPLRTEILGEVDRPLLLLMGASALLFLLSCSNVAGTLLARGTRREREIAIRTAVGASRGRLLQQLLTESLLLATIAGLLGLALAQLALSAVRSGGMDLVPRLQTVSIDVRVLLFALSATLLTSVIFGLVPALKVSTKTAGALRGGPLGHSRRRRAKGWNLLIAAEAALAIVLVVGSGLLVRSLQEILSVETHFRPTGVLTVALDLSAGNHESVEARLGELQELKREFEALPGVTAVGFINHLPLERTSMSGPVYRPPILDPTDPEEPKAGAGWRVVDEDYFAALGVPLLQGRFFSRQQDRPKSPPVVILNEALADLAFPGEDPIGKQIQFIPFWMETDLTVVGVVAEARDWHVEPGGQPEAYVYWQQRPDYTRYLTATIHTAGDPTALFGPVRERLRAVSPNVPGTIATLQARVGERLQERTFTLAVLGAFAVLALVLAAVGIYGVVSYSVSRRAREIGIQLALGATPAMIKKRIFSASLGVVALGTATGVIAAFALSTLLESLLYGVSARDPAAFAAAPVILIVVGAIAIWVPVRRTTQVDPVVTMRAE